VHEALNGPDKDKWHAAFTEELNNLTSSGTWELVPVPPGKQALPGRWVLAIKLDSMGVPDRYKARWVAKGFKQLEGLDYNETFSSVAKSSSWRILLALGAKYDWEIEHSDVVSAFLEAPLQEEVYVEQPYGYTNGNRNIACLLKRALYGLKQSSREWYNTLRAFFEVNGYERLNKDHSVFVHDNGTVVAVYVDDILMLAPHKSGISLLKQQLDKRFRMKHLGDISWYLGMKVVRDRPNRTIYINQASFTKQLLEQLDMLECHPTAIPMNQGDYMQKAPDGYVADREEHEAYRSLVGAFQWLVTMTRPDLAFSVGKCGRYTANPTSAHFNAAKRICRYLAGTISLGLRYGPNIHEASLNPEGKLVLWTDSSWADCKDTSRATSGYVSQLWNGPITWSSKQQTLCTISTAEAEYVAQAHAAKESLFLGPLLGELSYDEGDIGPVRLNADNQSAIKMASNPVNHSRTKHTRNYYHVVRQLVSETRELEIVYVNTSAMVADCMTKPVGPDKFAHVPAMLGLAMEVII